MSTKRDKGQCEFASASAAPVPRCEKPATRRYGDYWFCDEHGQRSREADSIKLSQTMKPNGHTIQTVNGTYFDYLNPENSAIHITAIAAALSKLCRFAGHTAHFYSVAQHSVRVSYQVPPEHAYAALFHDATEAYLVDLPSPLKSLFPEYKRLEKRVHAAIAKALDIPEEIHPSIKQADLLLLATERLELMPYDNSEHWRGVMERFEELPARGWPVAATPMTPQEASREFVLRWAELKLKQPRTNTSEWSEKAWQEIDNLYRTECQ